MNRTLSRSELYDMVWTKAVSKIAPELGISDVALRKRCVKHAIPLPDNRYWGRLYAGKPVQRTPLPKAEDALDKIVIYGSSIEPLADDVKAAVALARAAAKPIEVPEKLHKLVATTMGRAKRQGRNNDPVILLNEPDTFSLRAHSNTLDRMATFLNSLVHHANARSYNFEQGKEGLVVVVESEAIHFRVNQTIRRSTHVATEEEKQRRARWDAKHRHNWSSWEGRPSIPYYDFTPTGEMSVEIQSSAAGCPRRVADSKSTKLEQRIDAILDAFHAHALGRKRQREEARLAAISAEERRLLRVEEARLEAVEKCRRSYILQLHEQMVERDTANQVLAMLNQAGQEAEPYTVWLRRHKERLDEQLLPPAIMAELDRKEEVAAQDVAARLASPFYRQP